MTDETAESMQQQTGDAVGVVEVTDIPGPVDDGDRMGEGSDGDEVDEVLLLEEVDDSLVLPVWEPTGEPRVDEALDELARLEPENVHQHAEVFADVHERLRDVLGNLDASV